MIKITFPVFDIVFLIISCGFYGINGLALASLFLAYYNLSRHYFALNFVPYYTSVVSRLLRYGYKVSEDKFLKKLYFQIYLGQIDDYRSLKRTMWLSFILLPKFLVIHYHLIQLEKEFNI